MFKAGDRVICLEDNNGLIRGEIYMVVNDCWFEMPEPMIKSGNYPYVNHPKNFAFYKLYNPVEIKCEQDYYKWLANR